MCVMQPVERLLVIPIGFLCVARCGSRFVLVQTVVRNSHYSSKTAETVSKDMCHSHTRVCCYGSGSSVKKNKQVSGVPVPR